MALALKADHCCNWSTKSMPCCEPKSDGPRERSAAVIQRGFDGRGSSGSPIDAYHPSSHVLDASRNPTKPGTLSRLTPDRPWRQVAGFLLASTSQSPTETTASSFCSRMLCCKKQLRGPNTPAPLDPVNDRRAAFKRKVIIRRRRRAAGFQLGQEGGRRDGLSMMLGRS
jgi:hypothetical protein